MDAVLAESCGSEAGWVVVSGGDRHRGAATIVLYCERGGDVAREPEPDKSVVGGAEVFVDQNCVVVVDYPNSNVFSTHFFQACGEAVEIAVIATLSGLLASLYSVSRLYAMLQQMRQAPSLPKTVSHQPMIITAGLAILVTVFRDLSQIASMGAFLYLAMDIAVQWGAIRHPRSKIEARIYLRRKACLKVPRCTPSLEQRIFHVRHTPPTRRHERTMEPDSETFIGG